MIKFSRFFQDARVAVKVVSGSTSDWLVTKGGSVKIKKQMPFIVLVSWLSFSAHSQVLLFNMNDLAGGATSPSEVMVSGTPMLTLGGTDLVASGQAGVSFTDASGTVHSAGLAAAWGSGIDAPGGNSFQLHVDTTGYENFVVRYDYRSTSSGSPSAQLSYRVGDSGVFTAYSSQSFTRDGIYHSTSVDMASLSSIDNTPNVYLLWDLAPGTGSGTFRVDNMQMSAAAVPEPREYMLVSGAFLMAIALRRRFRGWVKARAAS